MTATTLNLVIEQGATFQTTFPCSYANGLAIDATGFTGTAQLRKHYESANAVPFAVQLSNSGLVASLAANVTAAMDTGRYVYDAVITSNTQVVRLSQGMATVSPGVTR